MEFREGFALDVERISMPLRLKLKLDGQREVQRLFQDASQAFNPDLIQDAILPAAKIIRDDAKRRVRRGPGTRSSGGPREHLRDLIFATKGKRRDPSVIAGVNQRKAPHAHLVEFGTQPHIIRPKDKQYLFFKGIFARFAQHPGSVKKPFFRPAIRSKRGQVIEAITEGLRKLLGRHVRPSQLPQVGGEFS
jgi:HK97 gp10 family phage protein